jgi:hypothetical protein
MANMYILQGRHNNRKTETLVDVIGILKNKYPEAKATAKSLVKRAGV